MSIRQLCYRGHHSNAILVPKGIILPPKSHFSKIWGLGGVCDASGTFVEESIYRFYFGGKYDYSDAEVVDSSDEVIYLGHLIPHWGVFLVDYTRRLWFYYKQHNPSIKLAFLGIKMKGGSLDSLGPLYQDFIRYSGIDLSSFVNITKVTKFKNVYVPSLGYDEDQKTYSLDFLITFNRIIDNVVNSNKVNRNVYNGDRCEKLYLSRTHFARSKEAGEDIIERFFSLNGFKVVYPEELSFVQQVLTFVDAKVIASVEGTIAHNVLFCQNATQQIIIRKQKLENWRQSWFNQMRHVHITYVECYCEPFPNIPFDWDTGPFLMLFNKNLKCFAVQNGMRMPSRIWFANLKAICHYLSLVLILIYQYKIRTYFNLFNGK